MSVITEAPAAPTRVRMGATLHRRFLWAAAGCTGAAFVIYLLMVRTSLGHRLDNAALVGSHEHVSWSARLHDAFFLRHINIVTFPVALAVIVAIGVSRRRKWLGLTTAAAVLLAVAVTDLLKSLVLTRPVLVNTDGVYPVNTFPSGHTATAVACALALVVVCPPAWRGVAAIGAGSYAVLVAAYVQGAGWHRVSDAIAGAFIAFAFIAVAIAALARTRRVRRGRRVTNLPALVLLGAAWIYGALRGAIDAAYAVHYLVSHPGSPTLSPVVLNQSYEFSISMTIVVVVSLMIALLLMLDTYDLDAPRSRADGPTQPGESYSVAPSTSR